MQECEDMMWNNPNSLLQEDLALLDIDFEQLGNAPAVYRQILLSLLSEMHSASNAAWPTVLCQLSRTPFLIISLDTERSIRFYRHRRNLG